MRTPPADAPDRPRLGNLPPTPPMVPSATPRDRSSIKVTSVTPASRRVVPNEAPPPLPEGASTVTPSRPLEPAAVEAPTEEAEEAGARVRGRSGTLGVVVVVGVVILLLLAAIGATAWIASTYLLG